MRDGATEELPRLILIARDHRGWSGDVDTFHEPETRAPGGTIDCQVGPSTLRFEDGAYHIDARLRERDVSVDLRLDPATTAAFVPNIPMLDGPPLHWVVVPRCTVRGTATIDGVTHDLDGAVAYHDHNWGQFLWGHDVAWEWGFVLPDEADIPWSLTFVRLTDRARTRALSHGLFVWRGTEHVALFREQEVSFRTALARFRPDHVLRVPRVMALVSPRVAADVPGALRVHGKNSRGWIQCDSEPEGLAQVLIPSEAKLGTTIFNEVVARSRVSGEIDGEPFQFHGRSVLEFIRA